MKKIVSTAVIGVLLAVSPVYAALVGDSQPGKTTIGYRYYPAGFRLSEQLPGDDFRESGLNTFYIEHKLDNRFTIGFTQHNGSFRRGEQPDLYYQENLRMNDVYMKYYVDPKVYLTLGNRSYWRQQTVQVGADRLQDSKESNKLLWGIGGKTPLSSQTGLYASFLKAGGTHETNLGIEYKLGAGTFLDVSYKWYDETHGSIRSMGFGIKQWL